MRVLPFTIDNPKCNIFVWRSSGKMEKNSVVVSRFFDNLESRGFGFVDKIRIKDIEFIALHDLGRWVVRADLKETLKIVVGLRGD